jgi:hypothetical protein
MNLKDLAKLKEKLIHATEFMPVMDYFMTEFGESDEFLDKGKPVRNELLEAALCEVGKQFFPHASAVALTRVWFAEVPGYSFTHGGFFMNGCVSTMIYFSDLQMGLLAVAMSMSGPTQFARFSGKLVSPNLAPSEN